MYLYGGTIASACNCPKITIEIFLVAVVSVLMVFVMVFCVFLLTPRDWLA
jgi:hypothetical protein